jgi:mono/diheme cytochrome c family protein
MRAITRSVPSLIALALTLALLAGPRGAAAQPVAPDPTLDATQLAGRNLFTQHCVVCHVKTLVTAVRSYGPSLSRQSLGGQEDVMRELISNGTPSMPGFKYSLAPNEIGAIIAYLKTLPVPPPAAAPTAPAPH